MKECHLKREHHEKIEIRQPEIIANMKIVHIEECKQKKCNREGLQMEKLQHDKSANTERAYVQQYKLLKMQREKSETKRVL